MANEIELKGVRYSIGRMAAMTQFHVSRRLAPVLAPIVTAYLQLTKVDGPLNEALPQVVADIQPVLDVVAAMKDADVEYVMNACLAVVQRNQMNNWAPVFVQGGGVMFDDIELPGLLQLVTKVLVVNLGPFMPDLDMSQLEGLEETQAGSEASPERKTGSWLQSMLASAGMSH
ncbi:hypothetical protein BKK79_36155 [Cupriavidus sp. USMAA2-4]|uniref:phage tail assembly chaperone n=1 Tax=Cupriavidus sp. USMAA2-4 TaxID=876364 RepID=UPI0008A67F4D|nr:hypothetical protein [Cupriavidus sp. USMAA2-4]AOY96851.1 hypothetical protein BKK79_35755 [Cupriavidus sp. USMAA2-4]AOY96923.1 hypothetical protein BKK79_36155 [Cupriavidus sp. USMAA2-4]